ncbi:MAG: dehydratase, partial [Hyphomicrobiales bacterium]
MSKYFEDIHLGEQADLGSYQFTAEEIIRFAAAYDPQPFHVDEARAADSHFGGLIASGWHTAAIWMKLMVAYQTRLARTRGLPEHGERPKMGPSPGFREMKWMAPVRAGDTIRYTSRVTEKIDLSSKP